MEQTQPDAASDDAMDSFLEKFQSQPYRGGFHKDKWEEVGAPRERTWEAGAPSHSGLPRASTLPASRRLLPERRPPGWAARSRVQPLAAD